MAKLMQKRPRLSRNVHTLTLGTGKVSKSNNVERIDLHFCAQDYDSLVTTRTRPNVLFTIKGKEANTRKSPHGRNSLSRNHEVSLPKTYLTRTGSMFLYSDRKIMKDKHCGSLSSKEPEELDITGQSITRPNTSASNSKWFQLLGRKKCPPCSAWSSNDIPCREKERYIKSRASDRSRTLEYVPYAWNYAVSPVKVINPIDNKDLKTVKGLSEAVLAYRKEENIENDTGRYLELIRQKWKERTDVEKQQLILSGKIFKATDWTRDWINLHRAFLRDSIKQDDNKATHDSKPKERTRKVKRKSKTAWNNDYDRFSRAPTNTPMSRTHQSLTRSSKRSQTRVTVTRSSNRS